MKDIHIILASAVPSDLDILTEGSKPASPQLFGADVTVLLAIALGVSALLFFWVFFIRSKPTHARGSLVVSRASKKGGKEPGGDTTVRRRKRRRGDHPENWSRNPTLSETGGLPPARPEESDSSSAQPRQ